MEDLKRQVLDLQAEVEKKEALLEREREEAVQSEREKAAKNSEEIGKLTEAFGLERSQTKKLLESERAEVERL